MSPSARHQQHQHSSARRGSSTRGSSGQQFGAGHQHPTPTSPPSLLLGVVVSALLAGQCSGLVDSLHPCLGGTAGAATGGRPWAQHHCTASQLLLPTGSSSSFGGASRDSRGTSTAARGGRAFATVGLMRGGGGGRLSGEGMRRRAAGAADSTHATNIDTPDSGTASPSPTLNGGGLGGAPPPAGGHEGSPPAPHLITEQTGARTVQVAWDDGRGRFVECGSRSGRERLRGGVGDLRAFLRHCFIPEEVSDDYFSFTRWRIFQRFVAATVSVLGTQALLLALGIKSRSIGAAAAISWVLKDALGKFVRILWASKMGRRFDSDAKRWRYRSSLLYATGSGLEIVTYVFPALFLVLATVANALKQMSMLTSSATRNTIYRSFARGENIGDITAKGEAQIACVDLLGLLSGVSLSRVLGTSRASIGAAYVLLSAIDIFAIYHEIRSVAFTMLNYERAHLVVCDHLYGTEQTAPYLAAAEEAAAADTTAAATVTSSGAAAAAARPWVSGLDQELSRPTAIARRENIFLNAALAPGIFRTVSGAGLTAERLAPLVRAAGEERYLLAYDARVGFSIVLRRAADGRDTLRALLALGHFERRLRAAPGGVPVRHRFTAATTAAAAAAAAVAGAAAAAAAGRGAGAAAAAVAAAAAGEAAAVAKAGSVEAAAAAAAASVPWEEVVRAAAGAQADAAAEFDTFLESLRALGWNVDKFMFGNIKCRADWGVPA